MTKRLAFTVPLLAALVFLTGPAAARSYVYATQYCSRAYDGAMDCAYFTLRQCLEAVSATGGDCAVNPRYAGEPPRYRKAPRGYR